MSGRPDRVEPDGMANPAGIPRSTLKFNILYHLALARHSLRSGGFPATWRPMSEGPFRHLFSELRRRKVFRVALGYGVALPEAPPLAPRAWRSLAFLVSRFASTPQPEKPMFRIRWQAAATLTCAALLAGCEPADPPARSGAADADVRGADVVSLLGEPLVPAPIDPEARAALEAQLAEARADYEADPDDAEAIVWLGRRLAYLARYRDAIAVFTEGVEKHPDDARMLRHRGHRHITVRDFDAAIRDLSRARELMSGRPDRVEPDGMPNPAGIPRSTLKFNILYHLALAHYLEHDFERALPVWRETLEVSGNDDLLVATSDWLYMTLRRLGRDAEAARVLEPIRAEMEILENDAYHRRLLMYRGELEPDVILDTGSEDPVQLATYGYGVGNWYLYNGDEERAFEIFRRILEGPGWAAFGYIAAEAEVAYRGGT